MMTPRCSHDRFQFWKKHDASDVVICTACLTSDYTLEEGVEILFMAARGIDVSYLVDVVDEGVGTMSPLL